MELSELFTIIIVIIRTYENFRIVHNQNFRITIIRIVELLQNFRIIRILEFYNNPPEHTKISILIGQIHLTIIRILDFVTMEKTEYYSDKMYRKVLANNHTKMVKVL